MREEVFMTYDEIAKYAVEHGLIVRCRDCIHFRLDNIPEEGYGFCKLISRTYDAEHYCADGKREA